jgi:uncharacterized protein
MQTTQAKFTTLREILLDLRSVLVAYSGGVDSTFLLKVAADTLGQKVLAVTERSEVDPPWDFRQAQKFAASLGVKHLVLDTEALADPSFAENPENRCYLCKSRLFGRLTEMAREHHLAHVVDGSNMDDLDDYRPGMQAVAEYEVRSPLKEANLTKNEIRTLSQELKLPTWDKPASPCLASRFPYGTQITTEGLTRVARAEEFLASLGIRELRVRDHGRVARIEVSPGEKKVFFDDSTARKVTEYFKKLGYTYVCLDLQGYRTGSMNETLDLNQE